MSLPQRPISVIGHKNPDTDSICSAIAYAHLKNTVGPGVYEPRRAGQISRETQFVLEQFGAAAPRLCTDVSPQVKDIDIRPASGIDSDMSLRAAWMRMRDETLETLCIVGQSGELEGLITVGDIAMAHMDGVSAGSLADAAVSYDALCCVLEGTVLSGDGAAAICGRVCIGPTGEPGDLMLVSGRQDSQTQALRRGAAGLVVCGSTAVPPEVLRLAEKSRCVVIAAPFDLYAAARLCGQAVPVRRFMRTQSLLQFSVETPWADAQRVMAGVRHRYFPVLDRAGRYCGVVSRRNAMNLHRKQVILVDHNEAAQAVAGLEEAEVLEIIDHHRLGGPETISPVFFRNEPVGSTATIIYQMYLERAVQIPQDMAGLLLSAILSDTLLFRSPTATPVDRAAAQALGKIASVELEPYARRMFEAGGDLTGRSAQEVFLSDFKVFSRGTVRFGVGQGSYMTPGSRQAAKALLRPYLPEAAKRQGVELVFYLLTDVLHESSELLFYGPDAAGIVHRAMGVQPVDGAVSLPGVVSRKKQVVPRLMAALQEHAALQNG